MVWTRGKNVYWPNSTQCTTCKIRKKEKQRQTQTTMDRQCKGWRKINWTDIEGSNGLDKGQRIMDVIHSYPSPPIGCCQKLMMMIISLFICGSLFYASTWYIYVDPSDQYELHVCKLDCWEKLVLSDWLTVRFKWATWACKIVQFKKNEVNDACIAIHLTRLTIGDYEYKIQLTRCIKLV